MSESNQVKALLSERRQLMRLWEEGEDVDLELAEIDAEIIAARRAGRKSND